MSEAPFGLSEKEREVLRLLTQGHDAKSAATSLGLSVHTVNERLREARAKTQSSSSRGAARLLAEIEGFKNLGPTKNVVSPVPAAPEWSRRPHVGATESSRFSSRWKSLTMLTAFVAAAAAAIAGIHLISGEASKPPAPKVISTFPTQGATVRSGRMNLSVTFDRPMRSRSYSFVQKSAETYPDCGTNQPVQSADRRTFTLTCEVEPGRRYEIWFNNPPYMNFADQNGAPAVPFGLSFQTKPGSNLHFSVKVLPNGDWTCLIVTASG